MLSGAGPGRNPVARGEVREANGGDRPGVCATLFRFAAPAYVRRKGGPDEL